MDEVVVGSTRKDLVVTVVDANGVIVNLTGGTVRLQGRSNDLTTKTLDVLGTLTNPAQGQVTFSAIGTLITQADLTGPPVIPDAKFRLRIKYTDNVPKFDYGPEFEMQWVHDPLVLA